MVAKAFRFIFWLILVAIIINLVFLDIKFLRQSDSEENLPLTSLKQEIDTCPEACLEKIDQIAQVTTAPVVVKEPVAPAVPAASEVKEFFISFGSGSTEAREWADMIGLEAYIDSSKYGVIEEVVFETGLNIPNGNQKALVQLFNVTDGHMVWNSEVSLEGGTPGLVISPPLTLSPGKKLYRVQMKTTVGDVAILTQSRIKITTR